MVVIVLNVHCIIMVLIASPCTIIIVVLSSIMVIVLDVLRIIVVSMASPCTVVHLRSQETFPVQLERNLSVSLRHVKRFIPLLANVDM